MVHVDGAPREQVVDYMVDVGRSEPRRRAAKRLEFISHPLWRLYDYVYTEGEALLRPWLDAVRRPSVTRGSGACCASR